MKSNVIKIEGGLGSQILAMITYLYMRELNLGVKLDVSFFGPEKKKELLQLGVTLRDFELDKYGYTYGILKANSAIIKRNYLFSRKIDNNKYLQKALIKEWASYFPIYQETYELLKRLKINETQSYTAVHIRRGDYLKVSSKIIELDEALMLLAKLSKCLDHVIIFVSDENFTPREKCKIHTTLKDKHIIFIDDEFASIHAVHGILRLSKNLITSNSTFSFTAAILEKSSHNIIISPTYFFSEEHKVENDIFNKQSGWMFL